MTARFTRDANNRWVIATPSASDANSKVMVTRRNREAVPMAAGEYLGTKAMKDGTTWHTYAIDRKRGGKAPTSGKLGENDGKAKGTSTVTVDTDTGESTVGASVDLSAYAKIAYVDRVAGTLERSIVELAAEKRVTIDIREADGTELRTLEGAQHKALPDVLAALGAGVHVYLVGPAGTGKTHLAGQAAEALGRAFYICGAMLTKHEVTGYQDANGRYVSTAAREAYENGGILLWDEVDSSMPAALVAVNAMLANDRYTFPDKTVERHPDFVCIAAGNTYGKGADREYVGRMQLDAATLDRFAFVEVDYDLGLERTIARAEFKAHGGTDTGVIEQWLEKVIKVRDAIAEANVRHVVSPRASIAGARMLARGANADTITRMVLVKGLDEDACNQIGVSVA